ncbi:DUF4244 domain-containing protein [Cellulomonas sp. P22]|uniref:DUF4244 domain-containing protein n=1 Tax=Cellulomonas sp. P22 TaxID=3373189 RepID=UPI0037BA9430
MGSSDMPSQGTDEQQDRQELQGQDTGRPASASGRRVIARTAARLRGVRGAAGDRGMATAEYAIATIAAVGFAGLLVVVLRSGEVQALLLGLIRSALST